MIYGITGNTGKDNLWEPAADLVRWMADRGISFRLNRDIAAGLSERGFIEADLCSRTSSDDLGRESDIILCVGGVGTLLKSAHEVGTAETPIRGISLGRFGLLSNIEVGQVHSPIT